MYYNILVNHFKVLVNRLYNTCRGMVNACTLLILLSIPRLLSMMAFLAIHHSTSSGVVSRAYVNACSHMRMGVLVIIITSMEYYCVV